MVYLRQSSVGFKMRKVYFIILLSILMGEAQAIEFLSPREVPQGGIALFYLPHLSPRGVSASFDGGEVALVGGADGVWGVMAVDMETPPGRYNLIIKGNGNTLWSSINVLDGGFKVQHLELPRHMVELDEKALVRIKYEANLIKDVWTRPLSEPLWQGSFIMPVEGRLTGPFGDRRIINGQRKSPHSGIDISAPPGTPVKASNKGSVALVGDFFFYGRTVILDHGLGVFTIYSHLEDVAVKEGEMVEKGNVIGSVGMTGRATGPHLHFGVRVGSARVSPNQLIEVTEKWKLPPS